MTKKIILLSISAMCFAISVFAAPLSEDTLQKCKTYLTSPNTVTPDTQALTQCYQNNVCGSDPAFANIPGCTKNLTLWNFQTTAPKTPTQQNTTNATDATSTTKTPSLKNTPNTTTTDNPSNSSTHSTTDNTTQSNQGKPQKPTINWF